MYSDPSVARFVQDNFVPVRVHVRDQREVFQRLGNRYSATWTPTILIVDEGGEEQYRVEGFLLTDQFLAHLTLGLGKAAFKAGAFEEAEKWFRQVAETYPDSEVAPEAAYWAGVSKYKATGDAAALAETAARFERQYKDTSWATRASVWRSTKAG